MHTLPVDYRKMIEKMRRSGRLGLFKSYREQPDVG
jgi:hypothetical protein